MKKTLPITSTQQLALIVKKGRKQQKLTQEDLAGMAGLGRRFISDLENGKETIQFEKVLSVLKTIGIALHPFAPWITEEHE
jgi:y4mF family transcriptional regulator